MKKEYESPEYEIVLFNCEDIITLSNGDNYDGGTEYPGGGFT